MTETRDKLSRLSPAEKAAMLALLRKRKQAGGSTPDRIGRREPGDPLRLSFGQLRLWFLDRLLPGDPVYNLPAAVEIRGALHLPSLALALAGVADRHEALRTTFAMSGDGEDGVDGEDREGGEPVQVIAPRFVPRLPAIDLAALPAGGLREAEVRRRLAAESFRPFDLETGPLLRACVFRTADDAHLLLLVMHHIVSDGWSMSVLVREVAALYAAFLAGRPSPLPALPVQYADFAAWQRRRLSGERLAAEIAWWRGRLAGMPPALYLPADHPRPVRSFRGVVPVAVNGAVAAALRGIGQRGGATSFMVLLAALQALLHRVTGQEGIVVGTPSANRDRAEIEGLIGFFINMLTLRVTVDGGSSFSALLEQARETALGAYAHRDLPFEKLVEELRPERDPGRNPLFQVAVRLFQPAAELEWPDGLAVLEPPSPEGAGGGAARFDLDLSLADGEHGFTGTLEYSRGLFERATAARLASQLAALLAGIAAGISADRETPIAALPLLTAPEAENLLVEQNGTQTAFPRELSITGRFAAVAAVRGDAPAVDFAGERLTYAELDRRAAALARRLRRRGVRPGDLVGLFLDRSAGLAVALLGILQAGGAYLPLDPSYPAERLAFMLSDASAVAVVTAGALRDRLPEGTAVVDLTDPTDLSDPSDDPTDPTDLTDPSDANHPPEGLAYVIYTSGSTGTPKGVAVTHRAVLRLVLDSDYIALGPADRVAQASNVSFDAATFEIWGALLNGGCLVGVSREVMLEPRAFAGALRDEGVTTLFLTTALFNQLAREAPGAFSSLHHLLFGGELVDPGMVRRVLRDGPPRRLLHVYGPTEGTTFSAWHLVGAVEDGARTVPIGRALANGSLLLLDAALRPVPPGVVGELYVGGEGLARGYLGRPALTAERFVPSPAGEAGGRLYRTGDLARLRSDHAVVFLGRADQQVKIRGFRIEPGEIEAALAAVPGVAAAVVVVREDGGDRRLVAYLTGAAPPGAAELRERLARRLPDHMVPAAFVHLPALPLTPNGKIDRAALPAPDRSAAAARDGAAPRTPVEEILAGLWADLLGVEGVSADDDFFALGGHSLLAVQLISRVRAVCGVELPLRSLFEAPTVAGLAAAVEQALRAGPDGALPPLPPLLPLSPAERASGVALSWAQQRLWILDQLNMGSTAYNMPMAVRLGGGLEVSALAASLGEIVRRHEALRTGFAWAGDDAGNAVQVARAFVGFILPRVDLTALPAAARRPEALRLASAEAALPFDLVLDALHRLTLLTLDPGEHVLLVTMHHVISDGWSMGVLMRELSALYGAFRAGLPSPLPELPVQYADFSAWQRGWLQGEVLESQLAYWRRTLAGVPVLELPTDRPRRALETHAGSMRVLVLPPEVGAAHAALCRAEGVTLFMSLLAAWSVLLRTYTGGQTDIVVGTPVANRGRMEIEGLIGFFVNTLVLRTHLDEPDSGREIVRRVRETALGAFAHQDVPFQKLVEELQPARSLQRSPFFQVFFILQNAGGNAAVPLPGVEVEVLALEATTAKLELTLSLAEGPDGIQAAMEYNTDLYDGATVDRMLRHFAALAAGLAASPDLPAADLPMLSAAERQQTAVEWNDTRRGAWEGAVVHRVFAACAAATPTAPAVVWADGSLTYGELDRQADRLARRLRRAGVGPEVPVGVFLERSPELFVAFLAVLKAGGAYLPLETTHPVDRLLYMLADAQAPVVVTRSALAAALPADGGLKVVAIDGSDGLDGSVRSVAGEEPPPGVTGGGGVSGSNLAYILYTSGSTGRPKGVAVTHEGVVRLARDSGFFTVTSEDTFLQITALSFDVSTFEIWGSLLNGARLALPPGPAPTLEEVGASIALHGVSILWLTSGLFGLMVDRRLGDLRPVRQLLAGGDVLPVPQVRRVVAELPQTKMINGYGPTENTTFTTCRTVTAADALRPSIPIGVPIGNTTAHIVDAAFRPVPAGVRGELCTGGLGVARGYVGLADLTAERFVPDPWSERPGSRLYRTGDLARWLPDGGIEFFGRADTQVKIRGIRIETGEVETVLGRHPEVAEAVVMAREDRPGDRRLVAYVVVSGAGAVAPVPADLQAFLRRSLPDSMIPAAFVFLAALPLTANGKVDRRALPAPEDAGRAAQASYTPPRTELERRIAAIWSEVLGVPQVGVHDKFFDLGGHSLLLLRVVSRLNEELGKELPRAALFEHPTVAALAAVLEATSAPSAGVEAGQDRAAARRESLQSFRQRRGRKDSE